eukprot:JP446206.1.p1 GENE.JP446206.1~~JP446206.1.p1  ORF type:complete len:265 (+),score=37.85 JP446206.1:91-795(+)
MGTEQLVEFLSHKIPCWNDDCSAIIRSQHVAGDVFFENSKEDWMHYGFILVYALRLTKLQNIILSGQSAGASGGGIPVDGDDEDGIDAFLTHDWGKGDENNGRDNHAEVAAVNTALKQRGIRTWFDQDRMEGVITKQMQQGIDRAATVVTFITKRYMSKVDGDNEKDNCQREFLYAEPREARGHDCSPHAPGLQPPRPLGGPGVVHAGIQACRSKRHRWCEERQLQCPDGCSGL